MATVNLGNIKFKWKGTYNGATAYTIDDVVEYNGSSYICKLASTGNLPTNTTYFDVMSQAGTNGTNGTDVGTVITTQGDLVYRDGSGLQRLGAGTAGQVLQTGGAGANPSWGTLSSDYVLLSTVTANNNTSVSFENVFDNTYSTFKFIFNGMYLNQTSDSGQFVFQLGYGATPTYITDSSYTTVGHSAYQNTSSSGDTSASGNFAYNYIYGYLYGGLTFPGSNSKKHAYNGEISVYGINTTDKWKVFTGQMNGGQSPYVGNYVFSSTSNNAQTYTDAITGVKFFQNSNLGFHGTIKLYGIK